MEIPKPVCALVRNDTLFDALASLCKFQFTAPQNDTERVREKSITDQGRHDLAVGPAAKFQFVYLLRKTDMLVSEYLCICYKPNP